MNHNIELRLASRKGEDSEVIEIKLYEDKLEIIIGGILQTQYIQRLKNNPKWDILPAEIFSKEQISSPVGIEDNITIIWEEWRDRKISEEETTSDFKKLEEWINVITKNEPNFTSNQ